MFAYLSARAYFLQNEISNVASPRFPVYCTYLTWPEFTGIIPHPCLSDCAPFIQLYVVDKLFMARETRSLSNGNLEGITNICAFLA